jgi:Domain of unknown function (DUF4422)
MNPRIFRAHHQYISDQMVNDELVTSIMVGMDSVPDGVLTDRCGENISNRHSYAEMRAHYFVWKNIHHHSHVGFEHYRRHFIWDQPIEEELSQYDVLVPEPLTEEPNISEHYATCHKEADWQRFVEVCQRHNLLVDEELEHLYPFNMFVMDSELFDNYMQTWYDITEELWNSLKIDSEGYQSRTIGFLSERLFTFWVNQLDPVLRVKELPIILIS